VLKDLQTEVDKLPEHTGVEATISVDDFGAQFVDAEELLQEEKKVLDLQGC
jgi:hypothetical protein